MPPIGQVGQIVKIGNQPVSSGAGIVRWVDTPESEPHGWGARFLMTFLFPAGK